MRYNAAAFDFGFPRGAGSWEGGGGASWGGDSSSSRSGRSRGSGDGGASAGKAAGGIVPFLITVLKLFICLGLGIALASLMIYISAKLRAAVDPRRPDVS